MSGDSDHAIPHPIEDGPEERPADHSTDYPEEQPTRERQQANIHLSHASRAPNTANSCIFFGCLRQTLQVPQHTKIRMLNEFNYYVPLAARIC